jgi:hypothetical protein
MLARASGLARRLRRYLQRGDDTNRTLLTPASPPFFEAATMARVVVRKFWRWLDFPNQHRTSKNDRG